MPSMRRRPHRWAPWALALVLSSALEITLSEESTLSESSIISEKSPPGDVPTSTSKSSQFSGKWYAGPNASLAFEFRSLHANGLLLYADDAIGHGFFVEAKLVDGRVTLRYRLPTGSSTGSGDRSLTSQQKRGSQQGITSSATIASRITFGRNVSDGLWHRLEMFRSGTEFTHWRLDEELRSDVSTASYIVSSSTPDADEADDSMMSADLFMYFGGLSHPSINTFARKSSNEKPLTARDLRLNSWSVPTAFFERPFIGELRNIILSGPPEGPALTELRPSHVRASAALEPSSTSQNQDDTGFHSNAGGAPAICERNTCGRGSKCIDTPDGPICPDGKNVQDCKDNLHNDRFCNDSYKPEKDSPPSSSAAAAGEDVIQLNGAASFLRFNQREPIISSTENISLQFRTTMAAASGTVLNDDPSNSSTGNDEVTLLYLGHESQSVELRLVAGVRFEVTITFPQWKSHSHNGALRQLDAGGGPDANVAGKTAVAHATVLSISSHSIQKGKRFDDGRWHRVVLTRRLDQISLNVDGKEATRTISVGEGPEHFYTSTILVGASGNTSPPEAGISSGPPYFFGCLKEVELVSSGLHLDLIRIAKTNLGFITASGEIEYRCSESSANNSATAGSKGSPSGTDSANPLGATGAMAKKNHKDQAISFLTPESFIIVLNWTPSGEAYSNSGYNKRKPVLGGWVGGKGRSEISFQFRTTEDSGVLLYSSPATMSHNERAFFFVIELRQGHLELRIGVGGFRRRASVFLPGGGRTSDGQWHKLTLSMDRTGYVIFRADHDAQGNRGPGASNAETNGAIREFRVHGSPGSLYETGGPLFVGGISDLGKNSYPSGLWSEPDLHRGFAGCLRDLSVGGVKLDLRTNLAVAGVQSGCSRAGAPKCPASPCFHGAVCNEGWNRPICDCSRTHFAGPTCETPALSLHFTGSEHITATLPEHQASFGEEIVFRFRTEMSSCTVFASQPGGLLQGSLQDGKFRLAYRFSAASVSQRNGSQDLQRC
ncbi:neurexin-2-like [Varroa jacobsoni]|uniref:neurexin-2-like n=2 Tax=Varroa jacobsoni TaxID=62625 RepID=UPI000BF2D6E1|nr:neurexin-2-like [Varroa jacobsoni]